MYWVVPSFTPSIVNACALNNGECLKTVNGTLLGATMQTLSATVGLNVVVAIFTITGMISVGTFVVTVELAGLAPTITME